MYNIYVIQIQYIIQLLPCKISDKIRNIFTNEIKSHYTCVYCLNIHTWAYLRVMSHFFYSCVLLIWVNIALGCLKSGEHKCSFLGIICLDLGKGPFDLYFRSRQKCGRKSDKNQRHTRQFWRRTFIARALTNAATVVRRLVESASNFVSNSLTRFSRGSNLRRDSKFACRVCDFNTSDFSCPFMRLRPPEPQFFNGSTGGWVLTQFRICAHTSCVQ